MEWLLLLLVPVVLLMLAVKLLTVALLPDAVRRFREQWARSDRKVRLMVIVAAILGVGLAIAIEAGGGRWVAYALLAFLAVPVLYGALLPLVLLAQRRRRSHRG